MASQGEWEVTEAMIVYGGSFVQTLGRLIRLADIDNKRRLRDAFPEYLQEYAEIAGLRARAEASPAREGKEP